MIGRLNHVGIATPSIDDAIRLYRDTLGATDIGPKFKMAEQGVWVCFVNVSNSQIELIEPVDENSPITKFLKSNPLGGQHHICFEVDDLLAARDEMAAKGARILGEPRIGAHGTPIIFVHPKDMGGVLIELMQSPGTAAH
ncbi:MAG: methylmalonyl-CoA epimerase [Myxococcota bacterium]|nr:methylmalonyl-CoA epimerase [Myxococcota bacterium]